ncbi:hypothetical protein LSAT2_010254, partial [Lamellibrachia satsuma]
VKYFLGTLPNMPSHYCRTSTTKRYLELIIQNKNALYKLYQVWCNENSKKVASKWLMHCVFEKINLSFYQPKKDQCDICCAHETGHIYEETYEAHILKTDLARAEKAMVKKKL